MRSTETWRDQRLFTFSYRIHSQLDRVSYRRDKRLLARLRADPHLADVPPR